MSQITEEDDGSPSTDVGQWAKDKHNYLQTYLNISRGVRKGFTYGPSRSATFVDLFCGSGRYQIRGTDEWIDGSAVAAWKISKLGNAPFSEIYISDIDEDLRKACAERLRNLGAPVIELQGDAIHAATQYAKLVHPKGLHFAFIDPYNLRTLDFEILAELSKIQRMDMLIHVSKMDLQRNLSINLKSENSAFNSFIPGWQNIINTDRQHQDIRRQIIECWRQKIVDLGFTPSTDVKLIKGKKGQPLYWLLLAAKHDLAQKFWTATLRTDAQGSLF